MNAFNSVVIISVLFCGSGARLFLAAVCPDALSEALNCWSIKENAEAVDKQRWDCEAGDLYEGDHYFLESGVRAPCLFNACSDVLAWHLILQKCAHFYNGIQHRRWQLTVRAKKSVNFLKIS